jgi:hypothetical protein
MKFPVTTARPCKMPKGSLRRVPQSLTQRVLGYNVCCIRCGFVTFALQNDEGLTITESVGESGTLVSFSVPVRCVYCDVRVHLTQNEATLEEGPRARHA